MLRRSRVPEEVNRRIIDHCSDVLMPYTKQSKENLLREGIANDRIYVTGNPILEVLNCHADRIDGSSVLTRLGVEPGRFFLVTMHRAENVDNEQRLRRLTIGLERVQERHGVPLVCSLHAHRPEDGPVRSDHSEQSTRFLPPLGLFDFVALEKRALCVLTDSGTVQEECCLFSSAGLLRMRDVTERPETIECGSNILSGCEPEVVERCVDTVLAFPPTWTPPTGT